MEKNLGQTHWSDAAKAGAVLGGVYFIIMILSWQFRLDINYSWLKTILVWGSIAACVYFFGDLRAEKYGKAGFTYGQSMGFIISIMLFAGFIAGFASLLMQKVIAPDYYKEVFDTAIETQLESMRGVNQEAYEKAMSTAETIGRNPFIVLISEIFGMVLMGGLAGLVVSVFVKRKSDPFADVSAE